MSEESKNVCIVVLGDIGRSPRMQYHALSLAEHGHKIDIVGYGNTQPIEELVAAPLVSFHYLAPIPVIPGPRIINYVVKTIWQALCMLFVFAIIRRADFVLVQNPPAVPTLVVCWFYALLAKAKFIIDWHNYAYTIMAMGVGRENVLVKMTRFMESYVGKKADSSFCVTNGMKEDLRKNWGINATTLYDRPPEIFKPISLQGKHDLIKTLSLKYEEFRPKDGTSGTVFTEENEAGDVSLRSSRPGCLISSTSWTEDEDFSILLAALQEFENHHQSGNNRNLPDLICVITGKGPLKHYYIEKIKSLNFQQVTIITPWLESKDYPVLLASADLGVCLHTSSSGLDLPMKVVDMFGCGLPVCAYDFGCLNELVKDGRNGYVFKSSGDLSKHLLDWFDGFPNNEDQRETEKKFKTELEAFQNLRWRENWNSVALEHF